MQFRFSVYSIPKLRSIKINHVGNSAARTRAAEDRQRQAASVHGPPKVNIHGESAALKPRSFLLELRGLFILPTKPPLQTTTSSAAASEF